ncbi:hypothetical protein BSKO_13844 [Bryopsis sp. KO-2023]|nr:hypothetical protein BSKO_13844 [Bryopsis sp. KO-2023]
MFKHGVMRSEQGCCFGSTPRGMGLAPKNPSKGEFLRPGAPRKFRLPMNASAGDSIDDGSLQTGSQEWRTRPASISLTGHAQSPESWFVLAAFLRVVHYGVLWPHCLLYVVPVTAGMLLFMKFIIDREINQRPGFIPCLFGGVGLVYLICRILTI